MTTETFAYTGAVVTYTVTQSGEYLLTVLGGAGGNSEYNSGGDGEAISADIDLTAGEVLQITVGGQGGSWTGTHAGGGGGGSFVSEDIDGTLIPLVVAGGGGGAGVLVTKPGGTAVSETGYGGGNAQSGTAGGGGPVDGYAGGTNGTGGQAGTGNTNGGGGGGFSGAGAGYAGYGGAAAGGPGGGNGGFGGGGAGYDSGGGGGGYSGGGGGGIDNVDHNTGGGHKAAVPAFGTGGGIVADAMTLSYEIGYGGGGGSFVEAGATNVSSQASSTGKGEVDLTFKSALCFLPGTHILTPRGEVAVERLRVGDTVRTLSSGVQRISWIGTGTLMVSRAHRSPATPVIIRRNAIADGMPNRDLRVTKGHALYLDGVLIPAEYLVNHRSILWDDTARQVTFFHIELAAHEVILANATPAETYRDAGNSWMFANADESLNRPDVVPYAPVLTGGPCVDAVWQRLLLRSGQRLDLPVTTDPDLHLLVDGDRLDGQRLDDQTYAFTLPAGWKTVRIASRAAAQDEIGRLRDPRRLGVALRQIVLWHERDVTVVEADDSALHEGFHQYEAELACIWTNGDAAIPASVLERGQRAPRLYLHVGHTAHYPLQVTA